MGSVNQAGDWRVHLGEMRTHGALRAASASEDTVRRLSDRALRAAALNPDHSEAARAAAAAELRARGGVLEPWRLITPSFLAPDDVVRAEQVFFGFGARLREALGAATLVAGIGAVASAAVAFFAGLSAASIAAMTLGAVSVMAMVLCVSALLLRRKPARVLLLLPPADAATRAPLRRMMSKELRPFGHVLTFSAEARDGAVRSAGDYRARAQAMRNLVGMNLSAMLAPDALPLSAADNWRTMTLDLALTSGDALVADLSNNAEQTLQTLADHNALQRSAFVCIWGRLEQAEAALAARQIAAPCFYYAPDGEMQRRPLFRFAVLAAMRATHGVSA